MKTPHIPSDAPFSDRQRAWLTGFFAGMHTQIIQTSSTSNTAEVRSVHILYGSQTGNAESVANDAASLAKNHGLKPLVKSMSEIDISAFASMNYLLLITSTYGEGEMPDNAQLLWESACTSGLPNLAHLHYSVLALGDTSYDLFCQAGKDWDEKLAEFGAKRLYDRVDCDVDFEEPANQWLTAVIPQMAETTYSTYNTGSNRLIEIDNRPVLGEAGTAISFGTADKPLYNRKNPFPARLSVNRILTANDSSKETRHYEISIAGSGLSYEAGDALCVIPTNCPQLVADILKAIGCQGDEMEPVNGELMPLNEALASVYEIKLPSKEFVQEIANRSGDQELNSILASGDKEQISNYLWGRDILDLLLQFPNSEFAAAEFLALLKPLQHRAYSISSSGKLHPESVHLTVASVRYDSYNRHHKGVCSTFLADLVDENTPVRCFFTANKAFRVPDNDSLPMIMVGPGTGVAPFRAFLQERQFRQATGKNWLFFGERNAASDFFYRDELLAQQESGLLTRLDLAFSRDQAEKIYVQDRMLENAAELFTWLEEGGHFYVCGDAYRMAKDVDKALHDIIAQQGKLTEQQAIDYVNQLKKDKRYVRDVY